MRNVWLILLSLVCVFAVEGTATAGPLCGLARVARAPARAAARVVSRRAGRSGSATGIIGRTRFFDGDGRPFVKGK